jgi:hypothetical protein
VDRNGRDCEPGGLLGLVRLDLGDLGRDPPLGFRHVIGVLQPQEVPFRQAEELAQAQFGIARDVARSVDCPMDAIARHADRMRQLVLARRAPGL